MTTDEMPPDIAADEDRAQAWTCGKRDADAFHARSKVSGEVFETDGTRVGLPFVYADGVGSLAQAYADGYNVRAEGLAAMDAAAREPWHRREPARGATYPPMGERQG